MAPVLASSIDSRLTEHVLKTFRAAGMPASGLPGHSASMPVSFNAARVL
jgi:hypothetical protein